MKKILAELITMISFASDSSRAVVIPFMTREDEELNYWKTEADEIRAWKIVARELNSPIPKTFQNGLFDIGHFVRNKFLVRNAIDDTMILNHALFPESLKSLGYLGSLHSNETNWKSMRASGEDIKREA
jgi:DNA polymerase I-like protein with 3'-5' exonuclease and polymerase domains